MTTPNFKPRTIFCHDNLEVMRGMNTGCIDLVYLDPPFNTKKTFTAPIGSAASGASFRDIFYEEDLKDEWVASIKATNASLYELLDFAKKAGGSNTYNYCYLAYMAIRLIEIQRILKRTGSVYLHCDDTMSHYLKVAMDCIFGEKQFRNEIIWQRTRNCKRSKNRFPRNNDTILLYSGGNNATYHQAYKPLSEGGLAPYSHVDANGDRYRLVPVCAPGGGGYQYDLGMGEIPSKNGYRMPKETALRWLEEGILVVRKGRVPCRIRYLSDSKGAQVSTTWTDIGMVQGQAKESTGYPTQKPLALLERIIKASTNAGDTVLDPFCGCATACVAAEMLGRNWVGIDVSQMAFELVQMRIAREVPEDLFRGRPNFETEPPKRSEGDDMQTAFVYIMKHELMPEGTYKVGVSVDPETRSKQVSGQIPGNCEVIFQYETPYFLEIEKYIHQVAFPEGRQLEWVKGDPEDIKTAILEWTPLLLANYV